MLKMESEDGHWVHAEDGVTAHWVHAEDGVREPLLDAESLPTGYMVKMDVRMYVRTHSQISVYVH